MVVSFFATIDGDSCRPQWMEPGCYLLPASSFRRKGFRTPRLPEGSTVAADWGGFVASKLRGGDVGFDEDQYVAWLHKIPNLKWAAMWDLPCEPGIVETQGSVRLRQLWTREHAKRFLEWYGDEPFAWVPTIQGYDLEDYKQACEDMAPLIEELIDWYNVLSLNEDDDFWSCQEPWAVPCFPADTDDDLPLHREGCNPYAGLADTFRIGVGSLCARKNVSEIHAIVEYVAARFPDVPLHLWGVKVQALANWPGGIPDSVVSVDSAAWNGRFGRSIETINAAMKELGMSQREYGYRVTLPEYLKKVTAVLSSQVRTPVAVSSPEREASPADACLPTGGATDDQGERCADQDRSGADQAEAEGGEARDHRAAPSGAPRTRRGDRRPARAVRALRHERLDGRPATRRDPGRPPRRAARHHLRAREPTRRQTSALAQRAGGPGLTAGGRRHHHRPDAAPEARAGP